MKRIVFALCLMFISGQVASAQQTYYYPHIVVGGVWRTSIFITNAGSGNASGAITFTGSNGSPLNAAFVDDVNRPVGSGNTIPFQLGPGQTRKYVSVSTGSLQTGFATVTANAAVLGTAMFTQMSGSRMLSEAGVPMAIPLGKQAVFVDTTGNFKTGLAIANPNSAPLNITFELMSTTGQKLMTTTRTLQAFQHMSAFVHELFPNAGAIVGRLQFFCTNPMTSVALRFSPDFSVFTTMPPVAIQN